MCKVEKQFQICLNLFYVEIDGSVMKKISMLKWNVGKVCILLIIHVSSSLFLAPKVGCLNFHSLLELRRGLQYGF